MELLQNKYREAAKKIVEVSAFDFNKNDDEYFACHALDNDTLEVFYSRVFKPAPDYDSEMFHGWGWFGDPFNKDNQLARQLSLLFMAEIAAEGDFNEI